MYLCLYSQTFLVPLTPTPSLGLSHIFNKGGLFFFFFSFSENSAKFYFLHMSGVHLLLSEPTTPTLVWPQQLSPDLCRLKGHSASFLLCQSVLSTARESSKHANSSMSTLISHPYSTSLLF